MSQLNIYVPDEVEKAIRSKAQNEGKSISAYLAELVKKQVHEDQWQTGFFTQVVGAWEGDLPEVPRELPEDRDNL
jgi:recombinational DNA repair protein (RecF pathway)